MLSLLFPALFASYAVAANITTSIWLPGAAEANMTFLGSVVEQSGEQTVLALAFLSTPTEQEYITRPPGQATVGGTTFVAYNVTAKDEAATASTVSITIGVQCRRSNGEIGAVPTCTASTLGAGPIVSDLCAGLTVESLPAYCTESDAVNYAQTLTLSGESQYYINNFALIITGGTEKLGAVAAATPNASGASVTGPVGASGSGLESGTGAAPSQTISGASNPAQQSTGAAAPVKTMGPALVGLGAAAAAVFL